MASCKHMPPSFAKSKIFLPRIREIIRSLQYFNTEEKDQNISNFMEYYNLKNIVKTPACFKSDRRRTIDMILTNSASNFQNAVSIETGLSDSHCMIATVVEGDFIKRGPKIINYRDYRKFNIYSFGKDLKDSLLIQSQQASTSFNKLRQAGADPG